MPACDCPRSRGSDVSARQLKHAGHALLRPLRTPSTKAEIEVQHSSRPHPTPAVSLHLPSFQRKHVKNPCFKSKNLVSSHPDASCIFASFADPLRGWAVGSDGVIIGTADGGGSWAVQESSVRSHLRGVHAISPARAWAVGLEGTVLLTSDAGRTWGRSNYSQFQSAQVRAHVSSGVCPGQGGVRPSPRTQWRRVATFLFAFSFCQEVVWRLRRVRFVS